MYQSRRKPSSECMCMLVVVLRSVRSFLDLEQKPLVSLAMFRHAGKPMLFEQPLFAREMHAGELDQPVQLFAHLVSAVSAHQREPDLVQRVHQDAVLIVHRLYAHERRVIPGQQCHKKPPSFARRNFRVASARG